MNKVGYFGGTFNPIHNGHLHVANACIEVCNLDCIKFLVNNHQPFKKDDYISYNERCNMVKLAIKDNKKYEVSYLESSNTIHYTIDTIEKIYNNDVDIYFIIGEDSLENFHKWKRYEEIIKLVKLIVVPRTSIKNTLKLCKEMNKKYGQRFICVDIKPYKISSSDIRKMIANKKSVDGMLPKVVENYIKSNGIYA